MNFRTRAEPLIRPFIQRWWRIQRGMTLGVRGIVENPAGEILLVKHTYVAGWHFPGGGVERGEAIYDALRKELREEAGIDPAGTPELVGVYSNEAVFRGDHVAVFRVREWSDCAMTAHHEIAETGWFSPDALPDGIVGGARRRIAEIYEGEPITGAW